MCLYDAFGSCIFAFHKEFKLRQFTDVVSGYYSIVWFQITTLRESRGTAVKALEQQKEVNQQQQADLSLANQRLRMAKQNIQVSPHCPQAATERSVPLLKYIYHVAVIKIN